MIHFRDKICGIIDSRLTRIILGIGWSVLFLTSVYCFSTVHVDTFQNAGAYAGKSGGSIGWPMMGDWNSYESQWGFHWFGPIILRSFLGSIIPFHPIAEIIYLGSLWLFVCYLVDFTIRKHIGSNFITRLLWYGILVNSSMMISVGFYRPEALVAFTAAPLFLCSYGKSRYSVPLVLSSLFLLPILHPTGFVISAFYIIGLFVQKWFGRNQRDVPVVSPKWKLCVCAAICGLLGVVTFFLYYYLRPAAWDQFLANVKAQRLLPLSYANIFTMAFSGFRGFIDGSIYVLGLVCSLGVAVFYVARQLKNQTQNIPHRIMQCAFVVIGVWAYAVLGRILNPCHILPALPFIGIMIAWSIHQAMRISNKSPFYILCAATLLVILIQPTFLAFRLKNLIDNNFTSYRSQLRNVLASVPAEARVFLPVSLWEAAYMDRNYKNCYLYTFPNLTMKERRGTYESHIARQIRSGDYMVLDVDDEERGVFYGIEEIRIRLIDKSFLNLELWQEIDRFEIAVSGAGALYRKYTVLQRK